MTTPLPRTVSSTAVAAVLLAVGSASLALPAVPAHAAPAAAQSSRPDTASAIAQAQRSGQSVDVPALTTSTETVTANPDGTLTMNQSLYPTRVKTADGTWSAVDTTLHTAADGAVVPAVAPSGVSFSGGGAGPLATLTSYGKQMTVSWPSSLPKPSLSGSTATYADVLPDVDLAVTATPLGGFNEVLIVKTAAAAANPQLTKLTLPTSTQGLTLAAEDGGNLTARGSTGQIFFNSPGATMWDSSSSSASLRSLRGDGRASTEDDAPAGPSNPVPSTQAGPGTGALTAEVPATVSGGQISLETDASVLRGEDTHYPVYIDPSWNPAVVGGARLAYDEVQQGCPSKNALNSTTAPYNTPGVGLNDFSGCTGVERGYYQMRVDTRLWSNAANPVHIVSATFKATEVYSASCSVTSNVNAYVTAPIGTSTTWDHQPAQSTLQDTVSFGPACTSNPSGGFDVSNAYTLASTNHLSETTYVLRAANESTDLDFKRFSANPSVTVTYDTTPSVTGLRTSPAASCSSGLIGNTSITLSATVSDPDAGSPVYADFTLKNAAGTVLKTANNQGPVTKSGSLSWNIGILPSGKYSWTAVADDLKYTSAASVCTLTVDTTAPTAPTISSSAYPNGGDNGTAFVDKRLPDGGSFTFTPASGTTDTVKYAYNWGSRPPTVNPPNTVTPTSGTAQVSTPPLFPTGLHNILFVVAIDAAGNQSPVATYEFNLEALTSHTPGDITGDGKPDLVTVGTDGNLDLYPGTGTGHLGGLNPIYRNVDFTGALLSIGDLSANNSPGVLARLSNGTLNFYPGNSDAEPLYTSPDQPVTENEPEGDTFTNWAQATQLVVASGIYGGPGSMAGDADGDGMGPDEFATTADGTLWFIPNVPYGIFPTEVASGWQGKTIVAAGPYQGYEALWVRDNTTGELDLYPGGPNIIPASAASLPHIALKSGLTASTYPQLFSAQDSNSDGLPDLWAQSTRAPLAPKITFYPGTAAGGVGTAVGPQTLPVIGDRPHVDSVGLYRPNDQTFNLLDSTSTDDGFSVPLGASGDTPVTGDWNGDGIDTIASFNPATHIFTLRNSNSPTPDPAHPDPALTISFGAAGDKPVSGDWNGDGKDTIGVYRSSNNTFYLRNSNDTGVADITFVYGAAGDVPITGDWNGDGTDTIGVYRPSNDTFYQRNSNTAGGNDAQFIFGSPGDLPLIGDWTGHGTDTVGVWRANGIDDPTFYLHNANSNGKGDLSFTYGAPGDRPIAGDWSGR